MTSGSAGGIGGAVGRGTLPGSVGGSWHSMALGLRQVDEFSQP